MKRTFVCKVQKTKKKRIFYNNQMNKVPCKFFFLFVRNETKLKIDLLKIQKEFKK